MRQMRTLLSVDWDAFSGSVNEVFDSPLWGVRDDEHARHELWKQRLERRGGVHWRDLEQDFPLRADPSPLLRYSHLPTWVGLSHDHLWPVVESLRPSVVVNIDSHHDLYSSSGDPTRLRPGNWAGLALRHRLVRRVICRYPPWHAAVRVAEGFDLERTRLEIEGAASELLSSVQLERSDDWPASSEVAGVVLVQSPSWSSPAHDALFWALAREMRATELSKPLWRLKI